MAGWPNSRARLLRRTRPSRSLLVLSLVMVASLALGGCAKRDAANYAHAACRHVETSLSVFARAQANSNAADATTERATALAELRTAMPLAALAASDSSEWQALAATLGESSRVPESTLVPSLTAQCGAALSGHT